MKQKQKMIALVQKYHSHQTRSGGLTPYWHHCVSVCEILEDALNSSNDLNKNTNKKNNLLLAAIGHDLYEDTEIDREYIKKEFNEEVDEYIWYLTNEQSDENRSQYVQKIKSSPELAKLIKLADMVENSTSVAYTIHNNGKKWTESFFIPIIKEMKKNLSINDFDKFKKTAQILFNQLEFAYRRIINNIKKFN